MGVAVEFFDIWQAGYAGASVAIYLAGTNTLASLFTDQALTVPAANPQTLQTMSQSGRNYGKFAVPVYVGAQYEMSINGSGRTGVISAPISDLSGEDASAALVQSAIGSVPHALYDIVARNVDVVDQGVFLPTSNPSASSATNNATLTAAIGAAAALGGGFVRIPAGTYGYTAFSVSPRVIVTGQGRGVSVLQSQTAGNTVTFAGDAAALAELTLDGVTLGAGSVGLYSKAKNETILRNVMLERFETGIKLQGGQRADWRSLYVDNCVTGASLKGDANAAGGSDGSQFTYNDWNGGVVSNCTTAGIDLGFVDLECWHNSFRHVGLRNNTGTAVKITGARWTDFDECWWEGNTTDLVVADGSDVTKTALNTVVGLHISDFAISANMSFTGKCQDVVFERGEFSAGTYTLTTVGNAILTVDTTEAFVVTVAGNSSTQWLRQRRTLGDFPNSSGVTTDTTSTEGWSYSLAPGERVFLVASVVGNGVNVNDYAVYYIAQGAHRPGSTLTYDGQTVNFTAGATVTGSSSGATARIIADSDSGATGTLTLREIVGEFVDNETITDTEGGTAVANGVMAHQNAALLGSLTPLVTPVETDAAWAAIFGVTSSRVRVMVAGNTSKTLDWTIAVQVTSG